MKERPILFTPLMVQAILDDRKTQTRRIAKELKKLPCEKGDILWVQENYSLRPVDDVTSVEKVCQYDDGTTRIVRLTAKEATKLSSRKSAPTKKQPGRFMYRSCSRIRLQVTDVYNERLQDISEENAIAEGVKPVDGGYKDYIPQPGRYILPYRRAVDSFSSLWQSIHGEDSWSQNPFVWVIKFKKLEVV